ncbi:hypothetical protein ARMA_0780 [Ardenticatena maritima]|uniref:DUF3054 domain-containing protein n=1 Tax=Ardenticatena maritima TaxID=872965 RepID=A0A0M9UC11_9CHLR|nr:DUF3054 domain-containing protein [Ardenticatena maritima]KPL87176.1 hypothetical protein SE16_11620 [Ardenticatena maritima]GAP62357.1 hypothetical protein ARMA_0780 [Ardenticatena maritima]
MDTTPPEFTLEHRWSVMMGDAITLLLFAALGRASHAEALTIPDIIDTASPFLVGWFVMAPFLGAYRPMAFDTPRHTIRATFLAWAGGIPLGLLLRAWLFKRNVPLSFAIVTLATTLVMLMTWRLLFWWLRSRRAS